MPKVRISRTPMQYGGVQQDMSPITSEERDAWERMQSAAYQQGFQGDAHNRQVGYDFMQKNGVNPARLAAYQTDLHQQNSTSPWGKTGASRADNGWSGADAFYGPQTAKERYTHYSVQHNNEAPVKFGTDWKSATAYSDKLQAGRNSGWENFGNPKANINYHGPDAVYPENRTPVTATPAAPAAKPLGLASNGFPTREEAIARYKARQAGKPSASAAYEPPQRAGKFDYAQGDPIGYVRATGQDAYKYGGNTGMKRVRISAMPTMSLGGQTSVPGGPGGYGNQQKGHGYALDRFWSSPAGYPGATSQVQPFARVGTTLPEAKDGGDINAEKQERVLGDFDQDGGLELMNVNGPSHAEGGKDVNVPSNSFVFSDTKDLKIKDKSILAMFGMAPKRGGYTPTEIAKKYDLNKFKAITDNPDSDDFALTTAQLMTDKHLEKLSKLAQIQETMKAQMGMENTAAGVPPQQAMAKFGGRMAPRYQYAGIGPQQDNDQANAAASQIVNPVYDMYPTADQPISLPFGQNNKVIGIPHEEALKLLNGKDRVPYSKELAARIGYNGEYGHNTLGLQKWEQEQAPGYAVSPKTSPDGILGVRTLSPPMYRSVNPWENPHDTPPIPGLPASADPYTDLVPWAGSNGPASPIQTPVQAPPSDVPSKKKDKQGRRPFSLDVDPNFYGNLQNVMQMANLRKFQPYEAAPQAVIPDTVFMDPTRIIAAQQEMAQGNDDTTPQGRAMALARQGIAGSQAADVIGQVHNQNVGIANQASREAAAITNNLMERQAARLAELNKANFLSDRDYQREMGRLQSEFADRMKKQHDNRVKTAWLNKTSPYFNIDPVTQMPVFKSDAARNKFNQMYNGSPDSGEGLSSYKAWYDQALKAGMTESQARDYAWNKSGSGEHKSQVYKGYSSVPATTRVSGEYNRYGGMVPHYQVGGSFLPMADGPEANFSGDIAPDAMQQQQSAMPQQAPKQRNAPLRRMSNQDIATATHNPGNMKYASWMDTVGGRPSGIAGKDGGEFAAFPTFEMGLAAYKEQLFGDTDGIFKSNYYKPDTTVDRALKTWSNNGYGGEIYPEIKHKTLAQLSPAERDELVKRQIKAESNSTYTLLKNQGLLKNGGSTLKKFVR